MNPFAWLHGLFGPKKPLPPVAPDLQPGLIGDILRMGEAAGGDAAQAQQEQQIADGTKP